METLLPEVAWSNGQRATSCLPGEPQPRAAQRGDGGAVLGGSGGSPWGEGALCGVRGLSVGMGGSLPTAGPLWHSVPPARSGGMLHSSAFGGDPA